MSTSNVTRTIVADRDGMVSHLTEELANQRRIAADKTYTRRKRDHASGAVEGLEYAIRALQDWVAVTTVNGPAIPWPGRTGTCRHCGNSIEQRHDPTGQRGTAWAENSWGDDRDFQCGLSPSHRHAPDEATTVRCRCGYGPTTQQDLDEHVVAMMSDPNDHGEA